MAGHEPPGEAGGGPPDTEPPKGAHMTQPVHEVMPGLEPVPDAAVRPVPTGAARLQMQLDAFLMAHEAQLIDFRRTLHMHPELSLAEEKTASRLAQEMRQAGFEVTEKVGGFGIEQLLDCLSVGLRAGVGVVHQEAGVGLPIADCRLPIGRM